MSEDKREHARTLALFDVDGTLTPARKEMTDDMRAFMARLRERVPVGIVGGSDFSKIREQLGPRLLDEYDWVFSENGVVAWQAGKELASASLAQHLGEERLKRFVNFVLKYLATEVDCPVKRGTFIEFRRGMMNVSPIGRNCSYDERVAFEQFDKEHRVRATMVDVLRKEFADFELTFSIGGMISFDVFPKGWDKTYCLQYVEKHYDTVHFFGDKTFAGGNDHEIFADARTVGHTVTSPEDTRKQLEELFKL